MKVLDLQCEHMHVFEGWFASEDDYANQHARALITCPVCSSADVSKRLSAPRLNFGAAQTQHTLDTAVSLTASSDPVSALQQQWLMACRHILSNTVDVGDGFAEEARKIHYGEVAERAIRGHATPEQTSALLDEGIEVTPFLLPNSLTGSVQ